MAGSVVMARALDWTSTEECLRRPWCREAELPTALVKSKVGLLSTLMSLDTSSNFDAAYKNDCHDGLPLRGSNCMRIS